jgi:hypothetical protein
VRVSPESPRQSPTGIASSMMTDPSISEASHWVRATPG